MSEKSEVLQGKKVLVVDDSKEQRAIAAALYTELGLSVVGEAEDGLEAIEKLEELKPDIISLDIIMPNMDGIECYSKISKDCPDTKVLFLSCLAKNSEVREILTNKIDSSILLSKPCDIEVLHKALLKLYGAGSESVLEQVTEENALAPELDQSEGETQVPQ